MGINDVPPTQLIIRVAQELEKNDNIVAPAWASFVKTGMHKERAPVQKNWWQIRAAAVLRKLFLRGPVGVSKLRAIFGGRKNRGMKPERFIEAGGSHLRKMLQQLEKAGLAKQAVKGAHKGRVITPAGQSLLEKSANDLVKSGAAEALPVSSGVPEVESDKPKKAVKKRVVKKKVEEKVEEKNE